MTGPKVMGLDISITATGVAWVGGTASTLRTTASDGDERLQQIRDRAMPVARTSDLVVIEGPVVRSSAAVIIGMVHGAVRVALLDAAVPYLLVPPATLKKYATGKGNADKTAMAVALYKRAGLELDDDNQTDAWWLRAIGLELLGAPCVTMPAAHVAALNKLTLPAMLGYEAAS